MKTTRYLRARHSLPVESPDILHNGHRYRHVPFLPERRPAATGRIKTDWQLGNIQAAAPMPITSPGNDDDTGENHQPTLRKNTAEPVEQTLKQNSLPSSSSRNSTPDTLHGSGSCRAAVNNDVVSIPPNYPTSTTTPRPTHPHQTAKGLKKRARLMCGTGPKTHVRQRNATTYLMLVCA